MTLRRCISVLLAICVTISFQSIAHASPTPLTCPVPGSSFVDSWGAPRAGHTHIGTDMMAPDGTPILAPEGGTYRQHGNDSFYLDGDSGIQWFGTHLQGHIAPTGRVEQGQPVALVGHSGNASASAPHLHIEQHPGGGAPVNPFPAMNTACSAPSPEVVAALEVVAAVPPPTWPYTRIEVQRWWNRLHNPNIDRATAIRLAAYLNAAVLAQVQAYLAAVQQAQAHTDLVYRWQGVANCESGGNWAINTGNGYYGGVQFLLSTWRSVGGSGYPHQNSPGEQAYRAEILKNRSGLGQWPVCGRYYRG